MYVVPDSNILIADPWLRSQRSRVLFNYLARTRSRLVLLPSVESEVIAHFRRLFAEQAGSVEAALRQAARHELEGLPPFGAEEIADRTFAKWRQRLSETLASVTVDRPALNTAILAEALRRATDRIPPCDQSGKELRDTIVWLSLLDHCRTMPAAAEIAFLSLNTKDFASPDGVALRPELADDVLQLGRPLSFYPSLDAFNKAHADRVGYLTIDWVRESLGGRKTIEVLVENHLRAVDSDVYLRIGSREYEDYYEPRETVDVHTIGVVLLDVFVWMTLKNDLELGIEFEADVEADVECTLVRPPPGYGYREYDGDLDEEFPRTKTITCYGELRGVVAARIVDDEAIDVIDLEELEPR
jgi:hypothetical protein